VQSTWRKKALAGECYLPGGLERRNPRIVSVIFSEK